MIDEACGHKQKQSDDPLPIEVQHAINRVAINIAGHLEYQYPAALKAVPRCAKKSLVNYAESQITQLIKYL